MRFTRKFAHLLAVLLEECQIPFELRASDHQDQFDPNIVFVEVHVPGKYADAFTVMIDGLNALQNGGKFLTK